MKVNNSGSRSHTSTIVVSFLAGCLMASIGWFVVMAFLTSASKPVRVRVRENKQATAFFYRTANALFEGTYNSEDGSIREHALSAFRQVASKHGNMCYVKIYDNESGYHGGVVFFPSGHLSHITMVPHTGQDFVITDFGGMGWDTLWSSELRSALPKLDEDGSD